MNLKSLLCASCALLSASAAFAGADLTEGAVYRFTNIAHGFEITAPEIVGNITATRDAAEERRLWVVEHATDGSGFHLRDLRYGTYMTSPVSTSATWFTTLTNDPSSTTMTFVLTENTLENTAIQQVGYTAGQYSAAHANASGANGAPLVCWSSADSPSKWKIEQVEMSLAEVDNYRSTWPQASAPIQPGRVYHFTNKAYGQGIKISGTSAVGVAANTSDKGQLWIAEAATNGIIFRNFKNGGVLCSSRKTSEPWTAEFTNEPTSDNAVMYVAETPAHEYIFEAKKDQAENHALRMAHEAGDGYIVGWGTGATATFWNISLMDDITAADIEARRQIWIFNNDYGNPSEQLAELFADGACTILAPTYAAMSLAQIQASEAYQALPEVLQQMVVKVKTGDWSETDPSNPTISWDSDHARKFRVQMYEPYSDCVSASDLTCIHRYTNFNNPTGLIADEGSTLYVMVDKSAAPGATLYMSLRSYDDSVDAINVATDGTELHQGVNIIPNLDDNVIPVIYYTVTTNDGRTRLRPLSAFDPIKIHIEGGSVNGFFNTEGDELYTADTNQDWLYYRTRARFNRFPLISKHCILYFDFNDVTTADGSWPGTKNLLTPERLQAGEYDLEATLKAWDDMFVAEMLIMGLMPDEVIQAEKAAGRDWYDTLAGDDIALADYSDYFNNRLMGITIPDSYMYATWYRTAYNINTLEKVLVKFPYLGADDLWGPAHEFGHMNQAPMNIVGTTEESNNVFSNVSIFYRGNSTSRADFPSAQLEKFNNGATFLDHGTWGTTRMWFQLWLYYHAAGHNKKFYPRLYELLRENPLTGRANASHVNAKDDLLHFAKMACMAAGEDLTDFFDAWGFLQPIDGKEVDDYGSYTIYLTEEEIEQWRAEIAQLASENGWEKNTAIIFIDDRVGSDKDSYPEFDKTQAGEMGGLSDFISGNDAVVGEYEFTLNGTTVTVSGATGGAGFLIYDENGRLLGFSNSKTFDVSAEAAQKLISGEATFSVITTDNTSVAVADALQNASFETKLQTLKDALAKAAEFVSHADFTQTRVGYLKPSMVAALQTTANSTQALVDADEVTEENIDNLLKALNSELVIVENLPLNEETTIALKDGGIYVFITNKSGEGSFGLQASADGQTVKPVTSSNVDLNEPAQQWVFEATADGEGFYIRSVSQDRYINIPAAYQTALPLSETPLKFVATLHDTGFISLAGATGGGYSCIHSESAYNVVRWEAENPASQWSLIQINDPDRAETAQALAEKIAATRALAAELADNRESTVSYPLDETNYSSNAAPEGTSWAVLYDNDPETYFLSAGDTDADHHIKIQLPEATLDEATHLILTYTPAATAAPSEATIEYSADDEEWTLAHSLTQKHLPTLSNQSFESETFAVPAGTLYVRFTVSQAATGVQTFSLRAAADHATFAVSEMGIASHQIYCEPKTETYPASNAEDVTSALRQCRNAEVALNSAGMTSADLSDTMAALEPHYQTLLALKNNDNTSEIDKINAPESSAAIYDLQGRRLSKTPGRGIYIINGRKVITGSAD